MNKITPLQLIPVIRNSVVTTHFTGERPYTSYKDRRPLTADIRDTGTKLLNTVKTRILIWKMQNPEVVETRVNRLYAKAVEFKHSNQPIKAEQLMKHAYWIISEAGAVNLPLKAKLEVALGRLTQTYHRSDESHDYFERALRDYQQLSKLCPDDKPLDKAIYDFHQCLVLYLLGRDSEADQLFKAIKPVLSPLNAHLGLPYNFKLAFMDVHVAHQEKDYIRLQPIAHHYFKHV